MIFVLRGVRYIVKGVSENRFKFLVAFIKTDAGVIRNGEIMIDIIVY